jgi:hypothetical protein
MVNVTDDWDILAVYAGEKLGLSKVLDNDGKMKPGSNPKNRV